jgi:hypothetical protein
MAIVGDVLSNGSVDRGATYKYASHDREDVTIPPSV